MDWLKTVLLFFYGTTPAAIAHHVPQARMIAYTLGGIIFFVTVPFVFAGVTFLVSTHITESMLQGVPRWGVIALVSSLLAFGIIWLERALVILGDAVAPHWFAQICLLVIRLLMIALLSLVIAQKWEEASHRGLIRAERQVMRDEAVAAHRQHANQEFDVTGLSTREANSQTAINDLNEKLTTLPSDLAQAESKVQVCQLDAKSLWAEYSSARFAVNQSDSQREYVEGLRTRASVKAAECKQLAINTRQRIESYKAPLRAQLNQRNEEHSQLLSDQRQAQKNAATSYEERMSEAELALNEAGTDAKAFARVREKNPDVDLAVKAKTILLAAIEMLPLILKLLLWNSPISAEAKATLQVYSAWYRDQTRQSIKKEKAARHGSVGGVANSFGQPGLFAQPAMSARPCRVSPAKPQSNNQLDATGYWIGYGNEE